MKVTIEEKDEEIEFPCLMKSEEVDCIVLFDTHASGVVVHSGHQKFPIGYRSDYWLAACFKPFNGKIILEND